MKTKTTKTPTATKPDALFKSVSKLAGLSAFLLYLAEEGNDRLTINQGAFFIIAGAADLRGGPMTLAEIMERGDGILTQSLKNSYRVLLEPSKHYTAGLGWLTREPDPEDERKKYLRLTPKGRNVTRAMLLAAGAID